MHAREFLKAVLPQEGDKCWVSISKNKKVTQGFVGSIEDLVTRLAQIDAAGDDAYFGCASFKDGSSRRSENALGAKAFWLDIDCGEEKAAKGLGYVSTDIALQALDDFANQFNLPLPMVVGSGYGLHAYWILDSVVAAAEWSAVARQLKAAAERFGLLADPSRTADIASILRPPGTRNFKHDASQMVRVESDDTETVSFVDFQNALSRPQVPVAAPNGVAAAILGSRGSSAITEGVEEGGRNSACARFVGVCVAQGMDQQQTYEAALAWNFKNKPPMDATEVYAVVNSIVSREARKPAAAPLLLDSAVPCPKLPIGFSARSGGAMFAQVEDEEGETKNIIMAAFECYLIDVCRKERENKESYVFAANHPHNGWHTFLVSREEFDGAGWLSIMGANCTNIINPKLFRNYVSYASIAMKGNKMDAVRYEQFGWKEGGAAFLVGNALIRRNGTSEYAYGDDHLEPRMKGMKLQKHSTRAAWTVAGNKLYRAGFEAHGFGLLTSFAAPLMHFVLGVTDGGAILALHTQGSGYGKSNILQAIASVWGAYDSLSVSGADTENAKFNIISKACHLPVYEEEMGKNDPLREAAIIKRFVGGRDKNRARRDGSVEYKDTRFQTIMISASNFSLSDILRMSGDQGAMARVFEVDVEIPEEKEEFKEFSKITAAMLDNYGHAGREFIYTLMAPGHLEWTQQALATAVGHYQKLLESTPKDRYVVSMLACCLVAAKLVNAAGILSFDENRIMEWALAQAKARAKDSVFASGVEVINQFISENIMDCLVVDSAFNPKKATQIIRHPKNKIVMRLEKDTGRLFIVQSFLRAWLSKANYNERALVKELRKARIMASNIRPTMVSAGTDYPPLRSMIWEINMHRPEMDGIIQLVQPEGETEDAQNLSF